MNAVLVLLKTRLQNFARNKGAVVITFIVPVILIYIFGFVFGLHPSKGGNSGPSGTKLAIVNNSTDAAAKDLIDALKAEKTFNVITDRDGPNSTKQPLTEEDARAAIHDNQYRYALIIPQDFIAQDSIGIRLKFLSDPRNEIETQIVNGMLQKTIFTNVPQILGQSLIKNGQRFIGKENLEKFNHSIAGSISQYFGGDENKIYSDITSGGFGLNDARETKLKVDDPTLRRLDTPAPAPANDTANAAKQDTKKATDSSDVISRIFKIETEQVTGKQLTNPGASRLVGGYAVMFLLFAVSASATSLFEEKRTGIFQRILSAPVKPAHILWARLLFGIVLGLAQITVMLAAGMFFYKLDVLPQAGTLIVVTIATAAACTAFGLLLAAMTTSPDAAMGLANLLILTMSAVGGAWFPLSQLPHLFQTISKFTIVYWAVDSFTSVLWAGDSLMRVLPQVSVLFGIAAVGMFAAIVLFKRNKMFE